jgi:hypothetical protein
MRAGGSAGRHGCTAHGTIFEHDIDFDGRVAPAIENLAAYDIDNSGHSKSPFRQLKRWATS